MSEQTPIMCKQCGTREVEEARRHYATPVCYACLPPPPPLPIAKLKESAMTKRPDWYSLPKRARDYVLDDLRVPVWYPVGAMGTAELGQAYAAAIRVLKRCPVSPAAKEG